MLGYYITAGICLGLLIMIPIWAPNTGQPEYPFVVILVLAIVVIAVPLMLRRRQREGAAVAGELPVTLDKDRGEA